ncbi:protein asteroid homolog 1 isoform X2 [Pocillopora verrucosa]|uniref:protein asteroid homolog 1 isoform X2 n=1 Tax=Pocillopora verrucosa TaxID=203993 RepID=UPI00333F7767
MGIPGLTSYINSIGTLWTQIDLKNTKLIIDGSCLCHYLYYSNGLDCRCGGQYQEYYDAVVSFFDALVSNGVEAYVVFDGAHDPSDKKLETLKARAKERVETSNALSKSANDRLFLLPLLARHVFLEALRNRGVKFVSSDSEADTEIASLAYVWNCPVLSNDSDFFIFDIKAGYVPLAFFTWNSSCLTVRVFHRQKLASHFRIRAELIPLLASLAGNDYEYTLSESNLLGYFQDDLVSSSLRTQSNREINQWVLHRFRDGKFSSKCISSLTSGKLFMGIPVENCREISANCCSKWLRRFVYGILNDAETKAEEGNIKVIQEWDRVGLSVQQSIVKPYQEGVVPSLSLIPYLDLGERVNFLLFGLDSDTTDVRSLGKRFILIAASLRYLIKNAQPPLDTNHLIALLCCCVKLENDEFHNGEENTVSPKRFSWPFDIRAAQSFAQWQCVLRDAIHLNFNLLEPVPVPFIHKTFNGKMAQKLLESLQHGRQPEQLLPGFKLFRLFHRLRLAVTSGLLEKMVSVKNHGDKKRVRKTSKQNAASRETSSADEMPGNRFSVLCNVEVQR